MGGRGEAAGVANRVVAAGPKVSFDAAVVLLGSRANSDRAKGAQALAAMEPDKEHRAGVISKLAEVWREEDGITQPAAAEALAVWGDDAMEKAFIDRLLAGRRDERAGIFAVLAHRKTATAAQALARRLRVADDAVLVESHLLRMGGVAEGAVRGMLTDLDKKVCCAAARILQEIGTAESLPDLQKAAEDSNVMLSSGAKLAMEAIKARAR